MGNLEKTTKPNFNVIFLLLLFWGEKERKFQNNQYKKSRF